MRRLTFLGVTPAAEAWKTVLVALTECGFDVRETSKRLRISRTHFYSWLNSHPSIKEKFERKRVEFFRKQVTP